MGKLGSSLVQMEAGNLATFFDIVLLITLIIGGIKVLLYIIHFFSFCGVHCCRARCQKKDRLYRQYGVSGQDQSVNQVSTEAK